MTQAEWEAITEGLRVRVPFSGWGAVVRKTAARVWLKMDSGADLDYDRSFFRPEETCQPDKPEPTTKPRQGALFE